MLLIVILLLFNFIEVKTKVQWNKKVIYKKYLKIENEKCKF